MTKFYFQWIEKSLIFKEPAWTSRGILKERPVFLLFFSREDISVQTLGRKVLTREGLSTLRRAGCYVGEAAPLSGLSLDVDANGRGFDGLRAVLTKVAGGNARTMNEFRREFSDESNRNLGDGPQKYPSLIFAWEMAYRRMLRDGALLEVDKIDYRDINNRDVDNGDAERQRVNAERRTAEMLFAEGEREIRINGLLWMASESTLRRQVTDCLERGFTCLKMKVGVDWAREKAILGYIRDQAPAVEIRVDFNGSLKNTDEARDALDELSEYQVSVAEQPLQPARNRDEWWQLRDLVEETPVRIAFDEELIHLQDKDEKRAWMETVRPQALVLKPTLLGGFSRAEEWIALAREMGAAWWITSALESNLALEEIACWTYGVLTTDERALNQVQGLGTGGLFVNNFSSSLCIHRESLKYAERNENNMQKQLIEDEIDDKIDKKKQMETIRKPDETRENKESDLKLRLS